MKGWLPRWSAPVEPAWDPDAWRQALGAALRAGVPPCDVDWGEAGGGLFAAPDVRDAPPVRNDLRLPKAFVERAGTALCHADPARLPLLHQIAWRLLHGERGAIDDPSDPDNLALDRYEREVRRDTHKMKAFVRFRELRPGSDDFLAWFEPGHHIVDRVAPFFAKRFAGMRWAIFTPYRSVAWDGVQLAFGPGTTESELPRAEDADGQALWRTYYANIFNPARVKVQAMQKEMPKKYWKHLPEARLIPGLLAEAPARARAMELAAPTLPHAATMARGRREALAAIPGGVAGSSAADPDEPAA